MSRCLLTSRCRSTVVTLNAGSLRISSPIMNPNNPLFQEGSCHCKYRMRDGVLQPTRQPTRCRDQTSRRVLAVLESGEYFGESGVITYFNGGGRGQGGPPPIVEQFSLVASTHVELLLLRRKHYNIIEMQVGRISSSCVSIKHVIPCRAVPCGERASSRWSPLLQLMVFFHASDTYETSDAGNAKSKSCRQSPMASPPQVGSVQEQGCAPGGEKGSR